MIEFGFLIEFIGVTYHRSVILKINLTDFPEGEQNALDPVIFRLDGISIIGVLVAMPYIIAKLVQNKRSCVYFLHVIHRIIKPHIGQTYFRLDCLAFDRPGIFGKCFL